MSDLPDNYCGNCGKRKIDSFSSENFSIVFNYLSDQHEDIFSSEFKEFLEEYPFGFLPSKTRLLNVMLITGYTIRLAEERFLDGDKTINIEHSPSKKQTKLETIREIADYIDSQSSQISLDGVAKEYIIHEGIIGEFNDIVEKRLWNFFDVAKKQGTTPKEGSKMDTIREISFRNAVWGYLFRMIENAIDSGSSPE